jgi:hypothetical protein
MQKITATIRGLPVYEPGVILMEGEGIYLAGYGDFPERRGYHIRKKDVVLITHKGCEGWAKGFWAGRFTTLDIISLRTQRTAEVNTCVNCFRVANLDNNWKFVVYGSLFIYTCEDCCEKAEADYKMFPVKLWLLRAAGLVREVAFAIVVLM